MDTSAFQNPTTELWLLQQLLHHFHFFPSADCHGDCDEHIADESWASGGNGTPPGIMYPLSKINPFCMGCHPKDKIDTEQHKPLFAGTIKEMYCTDCHGNHRLTNRRCKWK